MAQFQEILKTLIKESDYTIYSLATATGIERSHLSKILSGTRKMSFRNFYAVLNAVCKSDLKRNELTEAYISEVFGKEKFENYFGHMTFNIGKEPKTKTSVTEITEDYLIFNNQLELLNYAAYLLSDKNKTKRVYTNFPTSILLDVASKKENCDFRCIVNSTAKGKTVSVFDLIKLNLLCCTSYIDDSRNTDRNKQQLYSFLIVTDDIVLLAKKDFKKGYYIRNRDLADMYATDFEILCKSMKINSQVHDNILDVKAPISKSIFGRQLHRVAGSNICVIPFMTTEDWDELARDDLPDRDYMIATTRAYYKEYFDGIETHAFITPLSGLIDFCEVGLVREVPTDYSKPLKVETRIAILERLAKFIKEHPDKYKINILKNNKYEKTDVIMSIESASDPRPEVETSLIAMASDQSIEGYFPGNYLFISTDSDSIAEYNDFFDLLSISNRVMTKDETLATIEDRILRLKYLIGNE